MANEFSHPNLTIGQQKVNALVNHFGPAPVKPPSGVYTLIGGPMHGRERHTPGFPVFKIELDEEAREVFDGQYAIYEMQAMYETRKIPKESLYDAGFPELVSLFQNWTNIEFEYDIMSMMYIAVTRYWEYHYRSIVGGTVELYEEAPFEPEGGQSVIVSTPDSGSTEFMQLVNEMGKNAPKWIVTLDPAEADSDMSSVFVGTAGFNDEQSAALYKKIEAATQEDKLKGAHTEKVSKGLIGTPSKHLSPFKFPSFKKKK